MNRDERNLGGDNVSQKRSGQARLAGKSAAGKMGRKTWKKRNKRWKQKKISRRYEIWKQKKIRRRTKIWRTMGVHRSQLRYLE